VRRSPGRGCVLARETMWSDAIIVLVKFENIYKKYLLNHYNFVEKERLTKSTFSPSIADVSKKEIPLAAAYD
jgi:hypothetical protein